jgi:hypothetical protein
MKMDIRKGRIIGRVDLRNTKELDHPDCQLRRGKIAKKTLTSKGGAVNVHPIPVKFI